VKDDWVSKHGDQGLEISVSQLEESLLHGSHLLVEGLSELTFGYTVAEVDDCVEVSVLGSVVHPDALLRVFESLALNFIKTFEMY
jgi:hypothetical protein